MTTQQALESLASSDLLSLGLAADAVRHRLHPENVVTYVRQTRLDLTISTSQQQLQHASLAAAEAGAASLLLRAAPMPLEALLTHFATLRSTVPTLDICGLSASFLHTLTKTNATTAHDILAQLQQAGFRALDNEDAPAGRDQDIYLAVHRAAHALVIPSTAELVFGAGESPQQTIAWLEGLCNLQSETNGFLALRPVPHHAPPDLPYAHSEEPTAIELLKTIAVCRLMADKIPHIETAWSSAGSKVLQMALRFGANDAGSALGEATASADHEEELRRIIREAGFRPAERESTYAALALY